MSILEIKGLSHRYDERDLFVNSDLTVNNGEHIGVVGLNGAGKSTFINILAGKLLQDEGEVKRLPGLRIGYLDQHATLPKDETVMAYLRDAFSYLDELNLKLEEIYNKMGEADGDELDRLIEKSAKMQQRLDDSGYYDLDSQIKKVANGLGVNKFGYDAIIGTLSGGERAKLMLSKLLLEEHDLTLLDEPTNFLDIEHVEWLVKYLTSYKKTFLVISHDVAFLNRGATITDNDIYKSVFKFNFLTCMATVFIIAGLVFTLLAALKIGSAKLWAFLGGALLIVGAIFMFCLIGLTSVETSTKGSTTVNKVQKLSEMDKDSVKLGIGAILAGVFGIIGGVASLGRAVIGK